MAEYLLSVHPSPRKFSFYKLEMTGTNHFSSDVIAFSTDATIRSIYWEKPTDEGLLIELHSDVDPRETGGARLYLVNSTAGAAEINGAFAEGRPVLGSDTESGSRLYISSSNGSSGVKRVTVIVTPGAD